MKIFKIIIIIMLLFIVISCKNQTNSDNLIAQNKINDDILTVDKKCAVYIEPTSDELKAIAKEEDVSIENDYSVVIDDAFNYENEAINYLKNNNLVVIYTKSKKILFIGEDNKTYLLDREKENIEFWNIIFFDGQKKPKAYNHIDYEKGYLEYYKN